MDYYVLGGRGALLLVTTPSQTKKGRKELLELVEEWLSVYASSNGELSDLAEYQRKGLLFLNERLREKRAWLLLVEEE